MTPFMMRVAELVEADEDDLANLDELAPMPMTRISQRIATCEALQPRRAATLTAASAIVRLRSFMKLPPQCVVVKRPGCLARVAGSQASVMTRICNWMYGLACCRSGSAP